MKRILPSAVNVLTNSRKIWDLTNGQVFQLNLPEIVEKREKSSAVQISAVFGTR